MTATSGPASTSTLGIAFFQEHLREAFAGALGKLHPATVARADDMGQPNRKRRTGGRLFLLLQSCERLTHHFGLGEPALARDSLEEGRSLWIDSDVQGAHEGQCIT